MNTNIANSRALGFGVLGIALWMFSVIHAGIAGRMGFSPQVMYMVCTAAFLGLLIAGLAAFLRKEGWLGFFFILWSGLIWGAAHMGHGHMGMGGMRYDGWFLMTITLVNFYLWFASLKNLRLGSAVSFMVLLLWVSFLALGVRGFFDYWVLLRVSGGFGLASALVAFYISAGALAAVHRPNMKWPGMGHEEVVVVGPQDAPPRF